MNIINLDLILLAIGGPLVVWVWISKPRRLSSQVFLFFSTIQAQYSWMVSWSLAKFCIFLLALDGIRRRPSGLQPFLPYVGYVLLSSFVGSFFWNIPSGVSFFYGEARIYVSLINFTLLVLSTMSLAVAFSGLNGERILWFGLRSIAVVHGIFFLYQYVAAAFGLPLIGISRAHGLTFEGQVADVAAFVAGSGMEIIRPGGLAGEPKTVAVIFGIVSFVTVYVGHQLDKSRNEKFFTICAGLLSLFCFLAALSTSGFLGLLVAFIATSIVLKKKFLYKIGIRLFFLIIPALLILLIFFSTSDISSLIAERTTDRMANELDPPVEASLHAIFNSLPIAVFGIGEGGSTFIVMEYLNSSFEYAFSPNIGFVRLAVENGLIGIFLFFLAYAHLTFKSLSMLRNAQSSSRLLFFSTSISAMSLCMAGSGIPLGLPLSIASMYAAQSRKNI